MRRSGFSLIELLLYTALAGVVLTTVAAWHATLVTGRIKNETINEVEQQGAFVLEVITQAVRNAEAITSPSAGSTGSSLVLDVYTSGDDPTTFDVSGGAWRICEGSGCTAVTLTSGNVTVSGVTLTNVSRSGTPGAVRVEFTLDHSSPSVRNEYDYTKTFYATAALRQP